MAFAIISRMVPKLTVILPKPDGRIFTFVPHKTGNVNAHDQSEEIVGICRVEDEETAIAIRRAFKVPVVENGVIHKTKKMRPLVIQRIGGDARKTVKKKPVRR